VSRDAEAYSLLPDEATPAPIPLDNRRVAVFGMGRTGIAVAEFVVARGALTTVLDERPATELPQALQRLSKLDAQLVPEVRSYEQFGNPEIVAVSPGVPYDHPLLQAARTAGAKIIGEIELAWCFAKVPIIAVTGTNGKGTVVTLIGDMLDCAGIKAAVAGNIGAPLIATIAAEEPLDVIVAEISSFQLETVEMFKPWLGILLNVSPDHRDRHPDIDEYLALKARIFANQDTADLAVLNIDDTRVARLQSQLAAMVLPVSLSDEDASGHLAGEDLIVRLPGRERLSVCSEADLPVRGLHNITNTLCASLAAAACGASADAMAAAIRHHRLAPHLLQDAGTVNGVKFIDDSKATNPAAAIADLTTVEGPLILIAGGRAKDVDLTEFADVAAARAEHVVLIGESAAEIATAIAGRTPVTIAETFEDAVHFAFEFARSGHTVLLAPACASFDMFENMAQRGEIFCAIVNQLAERFSG